MVWVGRDLTGHLVPTPIPGVRAPGSETFLNAWNIEMEGRASSVKEEGKIWKQAWHTKRCCGGVMAATSMPGVPQPELCWLTGQRAQSRLGVRGFGCSTGDVCWYPPEGDGITQARRTDHKLGNTGP